MFSTKKCQEDGWKMSVRTYGKSDFSDAEYIGIDRVGMIINRRDDDLGLYHSLKENCFNIVGHIEKCEGCEIRPMTLLIGYPALKLCDECKRDLQKLAGSEFILSNYSRDQLINILSYKK